MQIRTTDNDVVAYLERLDLQANDYNSPAELLSDIHLRHSLKIPFENLDILLQKPPSLRYEDLFQKIVVDRRGGYCYELNGLLYFILRKLDYEVDLLSARILFGSQGLFARGHKLLLVTTNNQKFLADVGYRNGLVAPLPFVFDNEQQQFSERFRLLAADENLCVLQKLVRGEWKDLYAFTLDKQLPIDFEPHNFYNSKSPESIFTQIKIASLKTIQGSISLIDKLQVAIRNGERIETPVTSLNAYQNLMEKTFGIYLSEQELKKLYYSI